MCDPTEACPTLNKEALLVGGKKYHQRLADRDLHKPGYRRQREQPLRMKEKGKRASRLDRRRSMRLARHSLHAFLGARLAAPSMYVAEASRSPFFDRSKWTTLMVIESQRVQCSSSSAHVHTNGPARRRLPISSRHVFSRSCFNTILVTQEQTWRKKMVSVSSYKMKRTSLSLQKSCTGSTDGPPPCTSHTRRSGLPALHDERCWLLTAFNT